MMECDLSKLRVLVVEDQADSRVILTEMLGDIGVEEVYEAGDGQIGLEFLTGSGDAVDVILCDWNMPIVSGMEFFRKIRANGQDIPLIMITGRGDHHSVLEARSAGVNGYIRKPFSPGQIEARLRILMQRMKTA